MQASSGPSPAVWPCQPSDRHHPVSSPQYSLLTKSLRTWKQGLFGGIRDISLGSLLNQINSYCPGPLGRVGHRIDVSVCSMLLYVVPSPCNLFRCLSLALRSYDQFPGLSLATSHLRLFGRGGAVRIFSQRRTLMNE